MHQAALNHNGLQLPIRNSRLKLSQGQVFWREVGQGEALIFLHGSWHDSSQWLPLFEQLQHQFHCLAPDLLGFGDSERPQHHYSVALEVECLAEYIQALGLQRFYLVGHSLGAWVAASYALKHLEQLQGLILIAPEGVEAPGQGNRWWRSHLLVGRLSFLALLLRWVQPIAHLLGLQPQIQRMLNHRRQLRQSPIACELLFQRRRAERLSELLQDRLGSLSTPTLIIQGEQDATAEQLLAQIYAEQTPQSTLKTLPGQSRNLVEAQAQLLAEQIQAWSQAR